MCVVGSVRQGRGDLHIEAQEFSPYDVLLIPDVDLSQLTLCAEAAYKIEEGAIDTDALDVADTQVPLTPS